MSTGMSTADDIALVTPNSAPSLPLSCFPESSCVFQGEGVSGRGFSGPLPKKLDLSPKGVATMATGAPSASSTSPWMEPHEPSLSLGENNSAGAPKGEGLNVNRFLRNVCAGLYPP